MPKFPNIPRLSVVVPFTGEAEPFENSLASVLQHRSDDCEVLVTHAGDYDDPFDIGDEVTFVDASSPQLIRQIGSAADVARGRFVHVLADGHTVGPAWSDPALAEFEWHETGVVVPVIRIPDESEIIHAGWRRSQSTACDLVGTGRDRLTAQDSRSVDGGLLSVSFWRRDLLRSLTGCYRGEDMIEASMVYGLLARRAGWRCVVADESRLSVSELECGYAMSDYRASINRNQRRLQAIADHFGDAGWGKSLGRFVSTALSSGIRAGVGRATAPMAADAVSRQIKTNGVLHVDQPTETLRIRGGETALLRRVA